MGYIQGCPYQSIRGSSIGFLRYVRHEWISDRRRNFVEMKRAARLNHDMDQCKNLNRQCKKSARQEQQNWAESKAIQDEAYLASGQIIECLCEL